MWALHAHFFQIWTTCSLASQTSPIAHWCRSGQHNFSSSSLNDVCNVLSDWAQIFVIAHDHVNIYMAWILYNRNLCQESKVPGFSGVRSISGQVSPTESSIDLAGVCTLMLRKWCGLRRVHCRDPNEHLLLRMSQISYGERVLHLRKLQAGWQTILEKKVLQLHAHKFLTKKNLQKLTQKRNSALMAETMEQQHEPVRFVATCTYDTGRAAAYKGTQVAGTLKEPWFASNDLG